MTNPTPRAAALAQLLELNPALADTFARLLDSAAATVARVHELELEEQLAAQLEEHAAVELDPCPPVELEAAWARWGRPISEPLPWDQPWHGREEDRHG